MSWFEYEDGILQTDDISLITTHLKHMDQDSFMTVIMKNGEQVTMQYSPYYKLLRKETIEAQENARCIAQEASEMLRVDLLRRTACIEGKVDE